MKFLWPWLAVGLAVLPARAETFTVDNLRLHPDAAWLRGSPQQEDEDDALLLSWRGPEGVALQVLVPRGPPLLKSDVDSFYRNLTRKWAAQYGKAAAVGWIEAGGRRWLSCRRPSRAGDGVVFQLVLAHEGRAYNLVAVAPAGTETLPKAVHELIAGADFDATAPAWRQSLARVVLPRGEALDALAQAEAETLGDQGMLLGHELKADPGHTKGEMALRWFLEGFRWEKSYGRDERRPFELRGRLAATAPLDPEGGELKLDLRLEAGETPLVARASRHAYCGPLGPWRQALAALDRGASGGLARLARDHPCEAQAAAGILGSMEAAPGQAVSRDLPLPPPPARATAWWLEVALSPRAGSPGEMLLDRVGLYFVYEPKP